MKKIIFSAALFAAASFAYAQDEYKYLTVSTSSAEQSIELATIQKITFDTQAQLVVVTTSEGVVKFPQSELSKMYFTDAATAIEALPLSSDDLHVRNGQLTVGGTGLLRIYNAAGALQRMSHVEGSATISLGNLPAGAYIINFGKQTIKTLKK